MSPHGHSFLTLAQLDGLGSLLRSECGPLRSNLRSVCHQWDQCCCSWKTYKIPNVASEPTRLIVQMVAENPTWGAPRIRAELLILGFEVSDRTVSRWMKCAPRDPEPAWSRLAFLRNHREAIAAVDFFAVPTITFGVLYCFFVITMNGGASSTSMSLAIRPSFSSPKLNKNSAPREIMPTGDAGGAVA